MPVVQLVNYRRREALRGQEQPHRRSSVVSTEVAAPSFRAAGAAPESIFGFSFVIDRHESPLA